MKSDDVTHEKEEENLIEMMNSVEEDGDDLALSPAIIAPPVVFPTKPLPFTPSEDQVAAETDNIDNNTTITEAQLSSSSTSVAPAADDASQQATSTPTVVSPRASRRTPNNNAKPAPLSPRASSSAAGVTAPVWVSDKARAHCMLCRRRFTIAHRRHHVSFWTKKTSEENTFIYFFQ